jgi:hypothetical protein
MAGLRSPFADGAFDPESIQVMTAAFEDAWQSLPTAGVRFESDQSDALRDMLARCIIEAAQLGERDRRRLRDAALACLAKAWSASGGA